MSIKIMNLIWEVAPYRGNSLLTLLALGDWSNDEGVCWPKIETLAAKSRQSVRSTQYALEQLAKDEMVSVVVNPGRGRHNHFQINTQKLHQLRTEEKVQFSPEKVQSATGNGAKRDNEKVQSATGNGAKRDSVIRKNHQEPSLIEPLIKPPSSSSKSTEKSTDDDGGLFPEELGPGEVQAVLEAFESNPVTSGKSTSADVVTARQLLLHFTVEQITDGILLGSARKAMSLANRKPFAEAGDPVAAAAMASGMIRSLAYFVDAIEEAAGLSVKYTADYRRHLLRTVERYAEKKQPERVTA